MYTLERFGSIVLPVFLTDYTLSPVPAQLSFVQTTTGVFDNDGEERNWQAFPFALSYKAYVVSNDYNANRTTLDALRGAVGTRAKLYRRADNDNSVHSCTARLVGMTQDRPYQNRTDIFEFALAFQQLTPWSGAIHGAGWVFDSGILLDTARTFDETPPITINTNPKVITVASGGNYPVTDIQFTVIAGAAITNVKINGRLWFLQWKGALATGDALIIDAGASMVLHNGSDAYNAFKLGDGDAGDAGHSLDRWAVLQPGSNDVTVTLIGGSTTSTISIVYNDGWA